jgi:hypothetical protein
VAAVWLALIVGSTVGPLGWTAENFQVEQQFEAIKALSSTLDRHGIDYWLFGGWAVDFWVGDVTRAHDDIDVAAWRADYDLIKAVLLGEGWQHAPMANEVVGTRYQWGASRPSSPSWSPMSAVVL